MVNDFKEDISRKLLQTGLQADTYCLLLKNFGKFQVLQVSMNIFRNDITFVNTQRYVQWNNFGSVW